MRVLLVCCFYESAYGGGIVVARQLRRYLQERGHQVDVLCLAGGEDPQPGGVYRMRFPGSTGPTRDFSRQVLLFLGNRFLDSVLERAARRLPWAVGGYDAVLCQDTMSLGVARRLAESWRARVGITLHESFPRQINAMVPEGFMRGVLRGIMTSRDRTLRNELRRFTFLVAISNHVRQRTLEYLGTGAPVARTVYNTCAEWFERDEAPLSPPAVSGEVRHLFVGRLSPEKGIDLLVEAFCRTPGAHLLTIVGLAGALAPMVRKAAATDSRIRLLPPMRHEELPAVYRAHGVVWCPATWEEPFGLTALEARISGCAVVTTRRGGLPEIIEGYARGHIVPARSEAERATAIADLEEALRLSPALVVRRADSVREAEFRERFSRKTFTDGYEALLLGAAT